MTERDVTRFVVRGLRGGSCNIAVTGTLDASAASSLRCLLDELRGGCVTLDLTECTRLTDDALGALGEASRIAEAHGGFVRLRASTHATAGTSHRDLVTDAERPQRSRRPLPVEESMRLLASESIGRVAVTKAGVPHVVPVNYVLDDGAIVFRTVAGSKLAEALRGVPVSFEVDGFDRTRRVGWSVMVSGGTELVTDDAVLERVARRLDSWAAAPADRTVRIRPDLVSGCELVDDVIDPTHTTTPPAGEVADHATPANAELVGLTATG